MEALHDINVSPADGNKRARFVLAILELTLLMLCELTAESQSHRLSKFGSCMERKELQTYGPRKS